MEMKTRCALFRPDTAEFKYGGVYICPDGLKSLLFTCDESIDLDNAHVVDVLLTISTNPKKYPLYFDWSYRYNDYKDYWSDILRIGNDYYECLDYLRNLEGTQLHKQLAELAPSKEKLAVQPKTDIYMYAEWSAKLELL